MIDSFLVFYDSDTSKNPKGIIRMDEASVMLHPYRPSPRRRRHGVPPQRSSPCLGQSHGDVVC